MMYTHWLADDTYPFHSLVGAIWTTWKESGGKNLLKNLNLHTKPFFFSWGRSFNSECLTNISTQMSYQHLKLVCLEQNLPLLYPRGSSFAGCVLVHTCDPETSSVTSPAPSPVFLYLPNPESWE